MDADELRPTSCMSALPPGEAARLLGAIQTRCARRSYTGEAVPTADLDALESFADAWSPWPGVRVVVLRLAPASVFAGIIGAYGGVSHSPSALVFIGSADVGPEAVGYTGEALVLEATAHGLDTCWVAGLFRAGMTGRLVPLTDGERIYAVSALGFATAEVSTKERLLFGAGHPKARRSLDQVAPGHETWPAWARAAVATARIAPSAMNRQPWRFTLGEGSLTLSFAGRDTRRTSKRLDCGIAMLHAEVGALGKGVAGRWEPLVSPEVARFETLDGSVYRETASPVGARSSSEIASQAQADRQIPHP